MLCQLNEASVINQKPVTIQLQTLQKSWNVFILLQTIQHYRGFWFDLCWYSSITALSQLCKSFQRKVLKILCGGENNFFPYTRALLWMMDEHWDRIEESLSRSYLRNISPIKNISFKMRDNPLAWTPNTWSSVKIPLIIIKISRTPVHHVSKSHVVSNSINMLGTNLFYTHTDVYFKLEWIRTDRCSGRH